MSKIRPIALCLFEHENRLLLQELWNAHEKIPYYRPPGGGIEFGEPALEAIRREMREELHSEIEEPQLLGVFENLFTIGPDQKHEVVFLYKSRLLKTELYQKEEVWIWDGDPPTRAIWAPLEDLKAGALLFYPEYLRGLIANGGW